MISRIKSRIVKEQFEPTFWGLFLNPFYFARKELYKHIKLLSSKMRGKILDVGCGQKPYEAHFNSSEYIGLELDVPEKRKGEGANVYYDGITFPFRDSSFDSVITSQTFEHVFNPNVFIHEIHRVLKDNGMLLMTVPFIWDEHEQPIDYARYSSFGIRHILVAEGFEIVCHKKTLSDVRIIFQLINAYIYKATYSANRYLDLICTIFLMSPFNLLGEILFRFLPKNNDLYLDNIILARKVYKNGPTK